MSRKNTWSEENYVKAFVLAQSGLSNRAVAKSMGVTRPTFDVWLKNHPALRSALKLARNAADGESRQSFREYVYDRLDPDLKKLWDEINACETEQNGAKRIESLLLKAGRRARQHLFLYAFTSSNFNASEACRKVNISRAALDKWIDTEPDFAKLLDEIHWHKGNFFENALINCVDRGDAIATIFANKTFNRERGYGEKVVMDVNVSGQVTHLNAVLKIDELDLDLETRKVLLGAVRARKALVLEQTEEDDAA